VRAAGTKKQIKRVEQNLAKTRAKDSLRAFAKLTHMVDGEARIIGDPPLIVPIEDAVNGAEAGRIEDAIRLILRSYRRTLPDQRALAFYAEVCGWTLAKAHARSGDAIALAAYLGAGDAFDRAMAAFAELYADQNERDYATLREAVGTGRITAESGL